MDYKSKYQKYKKKYFSLKKVNLTGGSDYYGIDPTTINIDELREEYKTALKERKDEIKHLLLVKQRFLASNDAERQVLELGNMIDALDNFEPGLVDKIKKNITFITLRFLSGNEIKLQINNNSDLTLNEEIINTGYFESQEYAKYEEKQYADGLQSLDKFFKIQNKKSAEFCFTDEASYKQFIKEYNLYLTDNMKRNFYNNRTRFIKKGKQIVQDASVKDLNINNDDIIHVMYRLGSGHTLKTFWLHYYNIPFDRPIDQINCYELMKHKNITYPYIPYANHTVACLDGSQCLSGQYLERLNQLRLLADDTNPVARVMLADDTTPVAEVMVLDRESGLVVPSHLERLAELVQPVQLLEARPARQGEVYKTQESGLAVPSQLERLAELVQPVQLLEARPVHETQEAVHETQEAIYEAQEAEEAAQKEAQEVQELAQEAAQEVAQEVAQEAAQEVAQEAAQEAADDDDDLYD